MTLSHSLMQSKFSAPIFVFYVLVTLAASTVAGNAANITVTDPLPATLANGLCSLAEAIENANDDAVTHADCIAGSGADTIQLAAATTYTITVADNNTMEPTGLPLVTSEMTIEGNGSTVQRSEAAGTPLFRILLITDAGQLTLNDLTVRNGATGSPVNGGFFGLLVGSGIRNFGSLTLNRCSVRDNWGETWNGGGIANSGTLAVNDSEIVFNAAGDDGGGIYTQGGTVSISNSSISNNSAADEIGGGIVLLDGTATLIDTTVSHNIAALGGGIQLAGSMGAGAVLTLLNSTVSHNNTDQEFQTILGGGGIANNGGAVILSNSTVSNNSSVGSTGGGIYNMEFGSGSVTLINTTLSDNNATFGGGLFNAETTTLHLQNTIIANSAIGGDCLNPGMLATNIASIVEDGSCNPAISGDPSLDVLANNGGATETHALMPTSSAIDAANDPICTALPVNSLDQRGLPRPVDGNGDGMNACDIGAYEQQETVPICNGLLATLYVDSDGIIVGGPKSGKPYKGVLVGTSGDDVILGTPADDKINGVNGDDTICGASGNDTLHGNNGDDTLLGGDGADSFKGNGGFDTVADFNAAEGDTVKGVEIF